MSYLQFVCVFMVFSYQIQGSSAVTPVFVLKGQDVTLDVKEAEDPKNLVLVTWIFNNRPLVTFIPDKEPLVFPVYSGRIEFPGKNYSVTLKKLQEADSGLYTARGTSPKTEQTVAEYNVTVQDPVSPVELTVDSVSKGSDSCNLTVSCRTQDSHINSTFRCDNQTCSQEAGGGSEVTTSGASLRVYLVNGSVICNHSNHVSVNKSMTKIQDVCGQSLGEMKQPSNNTGLIIILVLVAALVIVAVVLAVLYRRKKQRAPRINIENTEYDLVQAAHRDQHVDRSPTDDASPTSIYSLAGPAQTNSTEAESNGQPETLYACVKKPERS